MNNERLRYSELALPPYSYVPGHTPHPVSDPAGHMHGETHQAAKPLQRNAWQASEEYRFGIDLFNHGFYWEAHEAWESLWHAAGRKGRIADFLKGLIKLTAACVKAREGNPKGVRRHAVRAKELLSGEANEEVCGLSCVALITCAQTLESSAEEFNLPQPQRDLGFVMQLLKP